MKLIVLFTVVSVGGGTPRYEAYLEGKRAALRKALRTEFIRQRYHPDFFRKPDGGHLFDAALQRWVAVKATRAEYYYPTWSNFGKWALLFWAPTIAFCYFGLKSDMKFYNECKVGKYAYDHPLQRKHWNLF